MGSLVTIKQGGARATGEDSRWGVIVARDHQADGICYFSVRTTGVYCRRSCAARRPRRQNVGFHATCADAERGVGHANAANSIRRHWSRKYAMTVAELCRMIEHAKHLLTLDELAHQAIMSPYHFHRVFKSLIGLTPRSYTVAQRIKRIRQKLERSHPGTNAIYVAGFNSNGRFYETSNGVLGMPSSTTAPAAHGGSSGSLWENVRSDPSLWPRAFAASAEFPWAMIAMAVTRDLQNQFPAPI